MAANWCDVPQELINLIAKNLSDIDDVVRFGAVCKSVQSVVNQDKRSFFPWLMLAETDDDHEFCRKFYDLGSKKLFNIYLPELHGRKCLGSPFGWLLTIGIDLNISLVNPLSRVQISLPSQGALHDEFDIPKDFIITKVCNSNNPDSSDLIVMVIYSSFQRLAITSPNSTSWTKVTTPSGAFSDLAFFNGRFYMVKDTGELMICDVNKFEATEFAFPPDTEYPWSDKYYLVEIKGELHLVERTGLIDDYDEVNKTVDFTVHKLDLHTRKWIEVNNLGDYSLFLGTNTSFAISKSESPEFKSNCIFYTDDCTKRYKKG